MVKVALLVRLEAKPGKETAVAQFLEGALPLANQESTTPVWFALRLGPSSGAPGAYEDSILRKKRCHKYAVLLSPHLLQRLRINC